MFSGHYQRMSLPTIPSQPFPTGNANNSQSNNSQPVVTLAPIPTHFPNPHHVIGALQSRPVIPGLPSITSVRLVEDVLVVDQQIPPGDCVDPGSSFDRVAVIASVARILATCHDAGVVHGAVTASNVRVWSGGEVQLVGVGIGKQPADDVYDLARLAWQWWDHASVDAKTASVLVRAHDDDPHFRPSMAQVSAALADAVRRSSSVASPPATRSPVRDTDPEVERDVALRSPGIRKVHVHEVTSVDDRFATLREQLSTPHGSSRRGTHSRALRRDHGKSHHTRTSPSRGLTRWVAGSTRRGVLRGAMIAVGSSLATLVAVSGVLP